MFHIRSSATAILAAAFLFAAAPGSMAQQNQNWFVPNQARPAAQAGRPAQHAAPRPAPAPPPAPLGQPDVTGERQGDVPPPLPVALPPSAPLPPLGKGEPPPVAVMGVLDVPSVLHASTAYQEVEKVIGARRQKLNEDAQAEQASWRDLQQQLSNQRNGLSAEQIRVKEKDLQDRVTEAQRKFRDRNMVIQEAGQYALAQIDRALNQVVQQVALGRGMNLVLHRSQVALNMPDFDISDQVASQMNKMLPGVLIPPDGVSLTDMKSPDGTKPAATPAAAPAATSAPQHK